MWGTIMFTCDNHSVTPVYWFTHQHTFNNSKCFVFLEVTTYLILPVDWDSWWFVTSYRLDPFFDMYLHWWATHLRKALMWVGVKRGTLVASKQPILHYLIVLRIAFEWQWWRVFWHHVFLSAIANCRWLHCLELLHIYQQSNSWYCFCDVGSRHKVQ